MVGHVHPPRLSWFLQERPDTQPGDTKQDDSDEEMESSSSGSDDDDDDSASDDSASSSGGGAGGGAGAAADTMRPLGRRATAAEGEDEAENARQAEYFEAEPEREGGQDEATSFASLHLSRALLKAVSDLGYNEPTPIQVHHALGAPPTPATSPSLLARCPSCGTEAIHSLDSGWPRRVWERRHRVGQDGSLLAACTGAPAVPAQAHCSHSRAGTCSAEAATPWPRLSPSRMSCVCFQIVTPTRELATQIYSMFQQLAKYSDIRGALVSQNRSLGQPISLLARSCANAGTRVLLRAGGGRPVTKGAGGRASWKTGHCGVHPWPHCGPADKLSLCAHGRPGHSGNTTPPKSWARRRSCVTLRVSLTALSRFSPPQILDEADRLLEMGFTDEVRLRHSDIPGGELVA